MLVRDQLELWQFAGCGWGTLGRGLIQCLSSLMYVAGRVAELTYLGT